MALKCSLIIPTYNWPEALELVLKSVSSQSHLPDEIIVGDDGSGAVTKNVIDQFLSTSSIPIIHVWQEDMGNRKAKTMNKAIARSNFEYIIEIDGDIILHPDFIADHLSFAAANTYLYGSRVNIQKGKLASLFEKKQTTFHYFSQGLKKRNRTIRIPLLSKLSNPELGLSSKLRGCNVSFWRSDFLKINGYNEEFSGWGMEDSELFQRMTNAGVLGKRLKNAAIAYHIYHTSQDKSNVQRNSGIEQRAKDEKIIRTNLGIDQYL